MIPTERIASSLRRRPANCRALGVLGVLGVLASCESPPAAKKADAARPNLPTDRPSSHSGHAAGPPSSPRAPAVGEPVPTQNTRFATAARIVAFGDVHGDLAAAKAALRLAGALGDDDRWAGNDLVLVQTGDQLDRGDHEQEIVDLFDRLSVEAVQAGGAFHVLNGNHEFMNVAGDLRYVTPGGFSDFEDVPDLHLSAPGVGDLPPNARSRAAAFRPGGPYARRLATRNTAVIVGSTVFVHGGVEPQYAPRLDELNAGARAWLWGADVGDGAVVMALMAPDGLVWSRRYSAPSATEADCASLRDTLAQLEVSRMVVGHTVQQQGITSACDEQVWRIDVGMADFYGGVPAVLEIVGDQVRELRSGPRP